MSNFVSSQYEAIGVCQRLSPQVPIIGGDIGLLLAGVQVPVKGLVVATNPECFNHLFDAVVLAQAGACSCTQFQEQHIWGLVINGVKYGVLGVDADELDRGSAEVCIVASPGDVLREIACEISEARGAGDPDSVTRLLASWMCMYAIAAIENPEATFFAMFTELMDALNLVDVTPPLVMGLIRFFSEYCNQTFAAKMGCALTDAFRHSVGRQRSPKRKLKLPWKSVRDFQAEAMGV